MGAQLCFVTMFSATAEDQTDRPVGYMFGSKPPKVQRGINLTVGDSGIVSGFVDGIHVPGWLMIGLMRAGDGVR